MKEPARTKASITPAAVRDSAGVVGWMLAAYAALQIIVRVFAKSGMGTVAVQALAVELFGGKVDIAWSDPADAPVQSEKAIALRAARGAAAGFAVALLAFAVVYFHHATFLAGRASIAAAAFGLITAGLLAVRDELLFRGFAIRAFKNVMPAPALLLVCALVAAAGRLADPAATTADLVTSGALGAAFAAAWIFDRGAWMACGAHAAWIWSTSTLGRGVLFDVKLSSSSLDSDPAVVALLCVVAVGAAAFSAARARGVRIEAGSTMNGESHE